MKWLNIHLIVFQSNSLGLTSLSFQKSKFEDMKEFTHHISYTNQIYLSIYKIVISVCLSVSFSDSLLNDPLTEMLQRGGPTKI